MPFTQIRKMMKNKLTSTLRIKYILYALFVLIVISGCSNTEKIREECDRIVFEQEVFQVKHIPNCEGNDKYCCFEDGGFRMSTELKLKICDKFPEAKEQYEVCE